MGSLNWSPPPEKCEKCGRETKHKRPYCRKCQRYCCDGSFGCWGSSYCIQCEMAKHMTDAEAERMATVRRLKEDDAMGMKPRKKKEEAWEHKLVDASGLTACGKRDMITASFFDPATYGEPDFDAESVRAYDHYLRVDCDECLAQKELVTVHLVPDPGQASWRGLQPTHDRWKVKTAACGADLDLQTMRLASTESLGVTCLDCLETVKPADREHMAASDDPWSKKSLCGERPTPLRPMLARTWNFVNCVECHRAANAELVEDYIAESALVTLHNALAWARRNGLELVSGKPCSYCTKGSDGTICVVCAPLVQRDKYNGKDDEDVACAELLGVPLAWLVDFVSGFDGDGKAVYYRDAFKAGAKMARKFKVTK